MRGRLGRLLRGIAICIAPVLVALYVGATTFGGGTAAAVAADHGRPRRLPAGRVGAAGGRRLLRPPRALPFLYPPFAALLAVPLAVLPPTLVQVAWTAAGALALVAVLYRFGLTGWVLSLVATATVFFVQPVVQTLAFGQLGIFLVALVVLDLAPGPRVLPRRLLPEGTLTGLAAAIKLTPAIFALYLLLAGKRRAFLVTTVSAVAVDPGQRGHRAATRRPTSGVAWSTATPGWASSIIYYTNQSVMADIVRVLGLGTGPALRRPAGVGRGRSARVSGPRCAGTGWARCGLAVNLCGVAGLLASPVSWLHHFVWVVPLVASLAWHSGRRVACGCRARSSFWAGCSSAGSRARGLTVEPAAAQRGRRRARLDLVRACAGRGDCGDRDRIPGGGGSLRRLERLRRLEPRAEPVGDPQRAGSSRGRRASVCCRTPISAGSRPPGS